MDHIRKIVRDVPDFPKDGIIFRDITPVLEDHAAFASVITHLSDRYRTLGITKIAGIESRGFIFGAAVAHTIGAGLVLVRKPGKLPRPTHSASYELEYGTDTLHMHQDAVGQGDKVVIMDDLIATGGTAKACADLVTKAGAAVHEISAMIELPVLKGRARLEPHAVYSVLTY